MKLSEYLSMTAIVAFLTCGVPQGGNPPNTTLTAAQQEASCDLKVYYEDIDRSCGPNRGCALKDVANCCGAYIMCVSEDNNNTNPEYVAELCEQYGVPGACGYPSIDQCECIDGKCTALLEWNPLDPELEKMPCDEYTCDFF